MCRSSLWDWGKWREKKNENNRPNSYLSEFKHEKKEWDRNIPAPEYFIELKRVSKNQIIWGANFFASVVNLDSSCWIIWDKNIGGDQADGEPAYTSFKTAIRIFKGHPFIGTNGGKQRIHPTQKPIKLYEWLLAKYAKPGQRILDTHGGSMSSVIACLNHDFEIVCCELDVDYFNAGVARVEQSQKQQRLF